MNCKKKKLNLVTLFDKWLYTIYFCLNDILKIIFNIKLLENFINERKNNMSFYF